MTLEDLVPILIPAIFVLYLIIERLVPGKPQPKVRRWFAKGIAFFIVVGAMNAIIPAVALSAVGTYTVFHLGWLGTIGGAVAATVIGDLLTYWVHRGMHNNNFVWR